MQGMIAELEAEIAALRSELDRQGEAARKEQERLTFELGHRVKNTLSMVQALANQTFKGGATAETLPAFGDRVAALARANDAILNEGWTSATLGSVAPCVLEPSGVPLGPLTITGPDVRINASAALSFAMALHELATNAKRFGAWSGPHGRVALDWSVGGGEEPGLDLRWSEEGRTIGRAAGDPRLRPAFRRAIVAQRLRPAGRLRLPPRGFDLPRARADGRARHVTRPDEAPRAWQRMLSGRRLDLLAPSPDDIAIEDMAHGLARVARWNGQTIGANPFSVAQHSLLVETLVGLTAPDVQREGRLAALLHDGPEYVIGDLISPFKTVMDHAYKAVEHRLLAAIHRRFGLPAPDAHLGALIKEADRLAAFLEATQLAGFARDEAMRFFGEPPPPIERAIGRLVPLRAPAAERAFLARFAAIVDGGVR